jgi:polysaccharide biosynthesis/export protein
MEAGARTIVPRDLLQVTVFGAPELSAEVRVTETGEISLPLLGLMRAGGATPGELEAELVARLRETYMHDPHVSVQVKEEAAQPIYVLGEVNQAGAYRTTDNEPMTILRAVSLARGLKQSAASRGTVVIRTGPTGERVQLPVDLVKVLGGQAPDVVLQVNDVVYVPTNTGRAITLGLINALVRVVTFRTVF